MHQGPPTLELRVRQDAAPPRQAEEALRQQVELTSRSPWRVK